ncbi:MAG: hypothetical protein L0Z55_07555 [Planctomycetes bacterium]|nr:hypothetical protein [Planctomycetota bacterium]
MRIWGIVAACLYLLQIGIHWMLKAIEPRSEDLAYYIAIAGVLSFVIYFPVTSQRVREELEAAANPRRNESRRGEG